MEHNLQSDSEYWKSISEIMGEEFVIYAKSKGQLQEDLENAKDYLHKLKALRRYYDSNMDSIMKTFYKSKYSWDSSYPTDWRKVLSEIELIIWDTLRTKGRIVLYPQFPVDYYFVDFANPGLKIGLEIKKNATNDPEKKQKRLEKIKNAGYTIYEVSGKEMYRSHFVTLNEIDLQSDSEAEIYKELAFWLLETGDGVIQAIKEVHFEERDEYEEDESDFGWKNVFGIYQRLCIETLEMHKV